MTLSTQLDISIPLGLFLNSLIPRITYIYIYIYMCVCVCVCVREMKNGICWKDKRKKDIYLVWMKIYFLPTRVSTKFAYIQGILFKIILSKYNKMLIIENMLTMQVERVFYYYHFWIFIRLFFLIHTHTHIYIPRCSSCWKGGLQVALDYGRPTYLTNLLTLFKWVECLPKAREIGLQSKVESHQ